MAVISKYQGNQNIYDRLYKFKTPNEKCELEKQRLLEIQK